jgi:hypothetical protein
MCVPHADEFGGPAEEIVAVARHKDAVVGGCEPQLFIVAKSGAAAFIDADRGEHQGVSDSGNFGRDAGVEQKRYGNRGSPRWFTRQPCR